MVTKRPQEGWRLLTGGLLAGAALLLIGGGVEAQKKCPIDKSPKLRDLETISAVGGLLDITLVVKEQKRCVPTWTGSDWEGQEWEALRTYGFQKKDGTWVWSSPGPTLLVHKPGHAL